VLEVAFDVASGMVSVRNGASGTPFVLPLDGSIAGSEWMDARITDARTRLEALVADLTAGRVTSLDQSVARSTFTLGAGPHMQETALGNYVTDAMRAAVERATGERVDFAFQANGVIRGDLVAGHGRRQDDISFYDMATVFGMGTGRRARPAIRSCPCG
jgi:5'-nucleotidase / UDP-sugar diphosphatase